MFYEIMVNSTKEFVLFQTVDDDQTNHLGLQLIFTLVCDQINARYITKSKVQLVSGLPGADSYGTGSWYLRW